MNVLTFDVECSISNKGNPFDVTNHLVMVGTKRLTEKVPLCIDYWKSKSVWQAIQDEINWADILVAFNAKFDLHWLRKIGIDFEDKRIWDCQIGEFILNNQTTPYPSLDQAAEKYGFDKKLDVVKTEYWDKGIDTPDIPRDILSDYLAQDLKLTEQVFLKQKEQFEGPESHKYVLFKLQNFDLVVLEEIEWNGIVFDVDSAEKKAIELEQQTKEIEKQLEPYYCGAPVNLGSTDHVSCLLYGGTITIDDRIPVGVYKTGAKVGQQRYKILQRHFELPRLVQPLEGSELKKEGYWSTDDKTLRSLKTTKEVRRVLELLKQHSECTKLASTYMIGYPKLIKTMNWPDNELHGNLNQCVAVTGRLSSTRPNLQNADPETKKLMRSRYV